MAKTAKKHFAGDGWNIVENDFSTDTNKVAESIFSQGNEYMGCRGFLDENTTAPTLRDAYCNGVYEFAKDKSATAYKGVATRTHFMINACNFFDVEIYACGERFDMASSDFVDYERTLHLKDGTLERTLVWLVGDKRIKIAFERFFDMQYYRRAYQRITFTSDCDVIVTLKVNAHFNGKHWDKPSRWHEIVVLDDGVECRTDSTKQKVACLEFVDVDGKSDCDTQKSKRCVSKMFEIALEKGKASQFTRLVSVNVQKDDSDAIEKAREELNSQIAEGYEVALERTRAYWKKFWKHSDIEIEGDEANQQGIRFCIFQLQQTYHGIDATDNIGAKGLTGEAYSGHTFWDTETYCLPYYLYNNLTAAKYLLEYRYSTLDEARKRARDLDCEGACYPIATLNGEEACTLWQHASLQMQPSTGVAYGVYHYVNVSKDYEFLFGHGAEMLVEICRYLATRGQWDAQGKHFGYYAVMGPDEFQMMVNHNTYTNYMAKKTLLYTVETIAKMPKGKRVALAKKVGLKKEEIALWKTLVCKMKILYDKKTMLYEQHEGFYSLPHIDVDEIPDSDFPLYSHWSYDRIYRNDMIKQPDVLMFQLLYSGDFSKECKKANYEFYEPRCIHESSLSPSVHSIIACEIDKKAEAVSFFEFATRMDLDDYNRNAQEGLHTTSIAAAWLNIVYGFGGLRDQNGVSLSPMIPDGWKSYSFSVLIDGASVKVKVDDENVTVTSDKAVKLTIYGKEYDVQGKLVVGGVR